MQKSVAHVVNYVLNPVPLSIWGAFFISIRLTENFEEALFYAGVVGVFVFSVVLFILHGMRKKIFANIDVSNRKERYVLYPFVFAVLCVLASTLIFLNAPAALVIATLFLIPTMLLFELINKKVKGSLHLATVAAATTGFVYYYGTIFILSLLLIPLVGWARIVTKKHSMKEVIVGALYGGIFAIIGVNIVKFFI